MEPTEPIAPNDSPIEPLEPTPENEMSAGEKFFHDLDRINEEIVKMFGDEKSDSADLKEAWGVRAILIEQFADTLEEDTRVQVQFEVMVDKATIFERVGNLARYLEELELAEAFALEQRMEEMALSVGDELDLKTPELGNTSAELVTKLRGHVKFSDREYLRKLLSEGLDYEDFVKNVYRIILEEGGDPSEVFLQLGITV